MSRTFWLRAAALLLVVAGSAGCRDELPTAIGADRFPDGSRLISRVVELSAEEFLEEVGRFSRFAGPRDVGYHVVATGFEGALQARALYTLTGFPSTVTYTAESGTVTDSVFVYSTGEMVVPIDTLTSRVTGSITLVLHEIGQDWDPASASWAHAADTAGVSVPWVEPGGSPGAELARTLWTPRDPVLGDTVRWEVDSLAVARMAAAGAQGVLVIAEAAADARVQLGGFELRTGVRPESAPDTVIPQIIGMAERTFVYTPEPEAPAEAWMAGGITAARTLFRITLPERLRACPPGTDPAAACPELPLRDVTLNDVSLILDTAPVGDGFRPLGQMGVGMRIVAEPELGRRAPLGQPAVGRQAGPIFAEAVLDPGLFVETPPDTLATTVRLPLTDHFRGAIQRDTAAARVSTAFALLQEPEAATFGHARFAAQPRLRIVYTLPLQPTSP